MAIPIVVALWENGGFQGTKRTIVENTPDLRFQAFDNATSAIGIHPGPDFASFTSFQPTVTFFEHPFGFPGGMGRSLTLGPGVYSNIHGVGFGDIISSVQFNLTGPVALGGTDPSGEHFILNPDGNAATISPIPFIIELFTDSNPLNRDTPEDTLGNKLVIVESTSDVGRDFGSVFQAPKGLKVLPGPNFTDADRVQLCRRPNFEGGFLQPTPGNYADGFIFTFFDLVSLSVQFTTC